MKLATFRIATAFTLTLAVAAPVWAQDAATGTDDATETEAPAGTAAPAGTDGTTAPAEASGNGATGVETPSETPAEDAQSTQTSPGGDLAVGEALDGGPEIYVREEHGDWEVRCLRAPEGQEDPCQLFQRLADQAGNPTADVNFFDVPDGNEIVAGATILTPLQSLLTAQVTLAIDGGQPRRYPYSFCDQSGCYARMGFTAEDVAAFKRGRSAQIVVIPALAPDQRAELTMSLSGFTAGLAAVEVENEN